MYVRCRRCRYEWDYRPRKRPGKGLPKIISCPKCRLPQDKKEARQRYLAVHQGTRRPSGGKGGRPRSKY